MYIVADRAAANTRVVSIAQPVRQQFTGTAIYQKPHEFAIDTAPSESLAMTACAYAVQGHGVTVPRQSDYSHRYVATVEEALAALLATDRCTAKLCLGAGERNLVVPAEFERAFRNAIPATPP